MSGNPKRNNQNGNIIMYTLSVLIIIILVAYYYLRTKFLVTFLIN